MFCTYKVAGDEHTARNIVEKVTKNPKEYEDVLTQPANAVQLGYKLIVVRRTTVVKSICEELDFSGDEAETTKED